MQQKLEIGPIAVHASFRQLSDRHASSGTPKFSGPHEAAEAKRNNEERKKEVQQLIFGLGACVLASLAAGFAILLINMPK